MAVPSSSEPVAVDAALMDPPVRNAETDGGSAPDDLLKHKLGLANSQAAKAKREAEQARKQLTEMQAELERLKNAQHQVAQKSLEDQGAFKELYQQEKERNKVLEQRYLSETAELKQQLESVTQSAAQDRLRSQATAAISQANVVNPSQLYQLLEGQLRTNDDGQPVVLDGGVEQPLNAYLMELRNRSDWQHHFAASQARGMGVSPAPVGGVSANDNPYASGNITGQMRLEVENPELAQTLKAQARQG